MFFPAAEGVEDGVVQVFEGLVAPYLDGAGHHRVLLGELLGDWAADDEDLQGVESHVVLSVGWLNFSTGFLERAIGLFC